MCLRVVWQPQELADDAFSERGGIGVKLTCCVIRIKHAASNRSISARLWCIALVCTGDWHNSAIVAQRPSLQFVHLDIPGKLLSQCLLLLSLSIDMHVPRSRHHDSLMSTCDACQVDEIGYQHHGTLCSGVESFSGLHQLMAVKSL